MKGSLILATWLELYVLATYGNAPNQKREQLHLDAHI